MKAHTGKVRTYAGELRKIKRQVPYIIAKTLNDTAFFGRGTAWPQEVKQAMIIKSPWTQRSMRVDRASPTKLVSVLGSVEPYMRTQEKGDTQGKKGSHGVPIPAMAPANRGKSKRRMTGRNSMGGINLIKGEGGGTRKQKNAVALRKARKTGGGVVFLQMGNGHQGLYRVTSNRKPMKVWDLTHDSVTIPKNPTLHKAAVRSAKQGVRSFKKRFMAEVAFSARRLR